MQGHRTLPAKRPASLATLAELIAAGELTCSAAQVARWLNVSKPTVIAAARDGKLPGRQVGRQWRFSTKALAKIWGLEQPAELDTVLIEVPAQLAQALRVRPSSTAGGGSDAA